MKFLRANEYLVEEGNESQELFVLVEGRLGVYKENSKIYEISQKGSVVGEISLILNEPRSASIKALEDSSVLEFRIPLEKLVIDYPEVAIDVMKSLAIRLRNATKEIIDR